MNKDDRSYQALAPVGAVAAGPGSSMHCWLFAELTKENQAKHTLHCSQAGH
jgi:hypothetical protein